MDSRALAALLSSLISQLHLLVILLFPSSAFSLFSFPNSISNSHEIAFSLTHHLLTISEIAATVSLLAVSKKRKRTHLSDVDSDNDSPEGEAQVGARKTELGRVDLPFVRNPDSFRHCFRMTASTFEWLAGLLDPLLDCRDPIGSRLNLSAELRLGIGLYRLSTGSDYSEVARRFRVTQPVAQFCAKQLCRVLCTNFRFWVGFPSPNELKSVSDAFETLTGLPNCCGVIDCTRFTIKRFDGHALSKSNGKEKTIAAQIVVDSSSRILSIIAGFHGEKGNSRILKSSSLYKDIEGMRLLNSPPVCVEGVSVPQYLIGCSGYPLLPWLLVPFLDPSMGSCDENFNAGHRLMRISMLKTVASLKSWGILCKPIEGELRTAVAYIGACAILHNALLMREDYSALCDRVEDSVAADQGLQYCRGAGVVESSVERRACVIRSALAIKADKGRKSSEFAAD
ncbi:hypothetical protein Nepgr_004712 [Nepenthes gracilis]|uniref:DDE Tnp4 domain-containing protein n=1 Tax=Nepenthes gracilis TaxID=150966 RepID=A0AAD3S1S7_NEPGR|nr:hypothetical protein Nepgr_004712 [Nepenthes gracilis]